MERQQVLRGRGVCVIVWQVSSSAEEKAVASTLSASLGSLQAAGEAVGDGIVCLQSDEQ